MENPPTPPKGQTLANRPSPTRDIAAWAASVRYADIPPRVIQLAKAQAASVFAAAHAGLGTVPGRQVLAALRKHAAPGKSPVIATGETFHLDAALTANAALGMALDYDDYLFMGHTGHSAVWTSYLLGAALGAPAERILTAQVVANEVAGRLGAACILGPQNGQLWSHIHLAGAALAAGLLYGLNEAQLAHALGIAYAQPNYALFPGFMGPGSKLLTAATPLVTGLHAAQYAEAGLTGSPTILEDNKGFLKHFSYRPLHTMLSGLGSAWVTETLAIKPYPGCAYIDTTIDSTLRLRERVIATRGQFKVEEVDSIDVAASLLTIEMNRLSNEHFDEQTLLPVNINFNIPINVALALMQGELSARGLGEDRLRRDRPAILALSNRITLRHDWGFTLGLLDNLHASLGIHRFFAGFSGGDAAYIGLRVRRDLGHGALGLGWRQLRVLLSTLRRNRPGLWKALRPSRRTGGRGDLTGFDFSTVGMPFGSRVTLRMADGAVFTEETLLPSGSAAAGDLESVARAKLERELRANCDDNQAAGAAEILWDIECKGIAAVLAAVTAPGTTPVNAPVH